MVTFTICTYCFVPAAPLVSGGTNAKPRTLRLSSALWPSKLISVVTPVSGPLSSDATGSTLPLLIAGPVARGFSASRSGCLVGDGTPPTSSESGADMSRRDALITVGPPANAREDDDRKNEATANQRELADLESILAS